MGDFIKNIKNGVLYDMLWEPLKRTTKHIRNVDTIIPKGSYVCYVVMEGDWHGIFADKKLAIRNFKSDRKDHKKIHGNYEEINLILTYVTSNGDFIDNYVIG